jgi:hypothetical protein
VVKSIGKKVHCVVLTPMEYLVPSLRIASFTDMDDIVIVQDKLAKLIELKEDRFIVGFHQQV